MHLCLNGLFGEFTPRQGSLPHKLNLDALALET